MRSIMIIHIILIGIVFITILMNNFASEKYNCIKHYEIIKCNNHKTYFDNVTVTAYTNAVNETNGDEFTALMEKPTSGWTCAVSRDLMQFLGKKVYIEEYGMRKVNDLMNERYEKRIDLYVGKKTEARTIGKSQRKAVFINE